MVDEVFSKQMAAWWIFPQDLEGGGAEIGPQLPSELSLGVAFQWDLDGDWVK